MDEPRWALRRIRAHADSLEVLLLDQDTEIAELRLLLEERDKEIAYLKAQLPVAGEP